MAIRHLRFIFVHFGWLGREDPNPACECSSRANSSHDFRSGCQIKEGNAMDILDVMLLGMF
jgi:hypothetical protein